MKKFLFMALFAIVAVSASAQKNITIWWGGNVSTVSTSGSSPDNSFKALNVGVSYTAPIDDQFDWSAGVGYVTKGFKDWSPGFLQFEGNGAWNFVKRDNMKVNFFTGPYLGFMLDKDHAGDYANTVDFGWQGGLGATIKCVSAKIGYEYGFTNIVSDAKSKPGDFFFRVGITF